MERKSESDPRERDLKKRRERERERRVLGRRSGVGDHGDGEGAVVLEGGVELVLELAAPDGLAAGAVALGVAGLDHELTDDAVEDGVVVVPVARVRAKVLDGLGALVREELDLDVARGGAQGGLVAQGGRRVGARARPTHGEYIYLYKRT